MKLYLISIRFNVKIFNLSVTNYMVYLVALFPVSVVVVVGH